MRRRGESAAIRAARGLIPDPRHGAPLPVRHRRTIEGKGRPRSVRGWASGNDAEAATAGNRRRAGEVWIGA